jgi:hypothetical protein
MVFTISITDSNDLLGLTRAVEAQNVLHGTSLTATELLQSLVSDAAHNMARQYLVTQMDTLEFQKIRLTSDERAAIRGAALTNGMVADLCALLDRTSVIHFSDSLAIEGFAKLEAAGLIAPGRAAQILAL